MMVRNTIVSQKRDWPRALFTLAMTPPETRGLRLVGSQQLGAEARLVYHGRIDFQLDDPRRPPDAVLVLAREMKLLKLGHIALDGTRIDANASKHKAANKIEAQLRREVQTLLALAEKSDRAAIPDGMDVPAEIARREDLLSAIEQAKIEQRAGERHQGEQ